MTTEEREAWLAERRTGIGSSDAASVCGLEEAYGTPFTVYMNKVHGYDAEETEAMRWGNILEPIVAEHYRQATGLDVAKPKGMARHPQHPWMLANIDYEDENSDIVEVKTSATGKGFGMSGTDDIPAVYFVQTQHQMAVTGKDKCIVAALLRGNEFRTYLIRRDDTLIRQMTEAEEDLWDRITRKSMPDPDFRHKATASIISRMYSPEAHRHLELPPGPAAEELLSVLRHRHAAKGVLASAQKEVDAYKTQIEAAMGDACVLRLPGDVQVVRKLIRRAGHTVKPGEYYRMDIKGITDGDE